SLLCQNNQFIIYSTSQLTFLDSKSFPIIHFVCSTTPTVSNIKIPPFSIGKNLRLFFSGSEYNQPSPESTKEAA
ncbi:hypothetical protein ACT4UM_23700, partial [Bacillus sp. SS-TM]